MPIHRLVHGHAYLPASYTAMVEINMCVGSPDVTFLDSRPETRVVVLIL